MTQPVPLWQRMAVGFASSVVGALGVEGAVRVADDNALPTLRIFAEQQGRIVLSPNAAARVRRADGGVTTVRTSVHGLRDGLAHRSETPWLVIGDSQVLGLGVEAEAAFTYLLGSDNAGVPGYGVSDAITQAEALIPVLAVRKVLLVINEANDWAEGMRRVEDRHRVRGGWLLTAAGAQSHGAWFWSTDLSHSHVMYLLWMGAGRSIVGNDADTAEVPVWSAPDAGAKRSREFGEAIRAFAARHPDVLTAVAFLPADVVTSAARAARSPLSFTGTPWVEPDRPVSALRIALHPVPLVSLTPALADPDSFLERDYHLSPTGHARVGALLHDFLAGLTS